MWSHRNLPRKDDQKVQQIALAAVVENQSHTDCSGGSDDLITLEGVMWLMPKENFRDVTIVPDVPEDKTR